MALSPGCDHPGGVVPLYFSKKKNKWKSSPPGWSHPGDIWYNCLSRFRFDGINNNNNSLSFIFFLFASEKIHSQCSNQKVEKKIIRDELRHNNKFVISALLSFPQRHARKTKHEHHVEHGVENQHDRGGGVRLERSPGAGEIVRFYFLF